MKRLIVCSDGTWKGAADLYPSNVEHIARAVLPRSAAGVSQIVHSVSGVGTGETLMDRLLGGGMGVGLNSALISGYRFLALNYEPGDQIFLFGFSRGAYTARSLAGMISFNGLLTLEGVLSPLNPLNWALDVYRDRKAARPLARRIRRFRELAYQGDDRPQISFLGVFDTVGSLGIPGRGGKGFEFLDVDLSPEVLRARQALAIDDPRLKFTPAVWNGNGSTDLKQVWFDGDHTDIGGGHPDTFLSDETLRWMVHEASSNGIDGGGIEFKFRHAQPTRRRRPGPFDPMNVAYSLDNVLTQTSRRLRKDAQPVRTAGRRRILAIDADDVAKNQLFISDTAYDNWKRSTKRQEDALNVGQALDLKMPIETIPHPIAADITTLADVADVSARRNVAKYVRGTNVSGPRIAFGHRAHDPATRETPRPSTREP